jgi:hypothetical protein
VERFERAGEVGWLRGWMLEQPLVFVSEMVDGERGVEAANVFNSDAEQALGVASLVAELREAGVAGGDASGDQFLVSDGSLSRSQGSNGGFSDADLSIERGEADEAGAHQQADRGDQRDEEEAAENESLIETQHSRESEKVLES